MQDATFVIAVLGLVVSVANATWSVAQWKLNGARPVLELIVGAVAANGSGLVSIPVTAGTPPNRARLAQGLSRSRPHSPKRPALERMLSPLVSRIRILEGISRTLPAAAHQQDFRAEKHRPESIRAWR